VFGVNEALWLVDSLTSLAAVIAHKLGVSDSTGLGIAVLVCLSIGKASKTAFCAMTSPEELKKYCIGQ
jgi:hypothetical protein